MKLLFNQLLNHLLIIRIMRCIFTVLPILAVEYMYSIKTDTCVFTADRTLCNYERVRIQIIIGVN